MKNAKRILVGFLSVTGLLLVCGAASADNDNITNWCWEGGGYNCDQCDGNSAAYSMQCQGGWCAAIQSNCDHLNFTKANSWWTSYYSEEDGAFYCPPGYIAQGFDLDGSDNRGDNVAINCVNINKPQNEDKCEWSDWFSEEDPKVFCNGRGYIHGLNCDGGWCDNMQLYCCEYEGV